MKYVKYPSTFYLPWSPSIDDHKNVLRDTSCFHGRRVIVSEKMDGENTSMYSDKIHARSLDSVNHPSRNWVKRFWASINFLIPEDIRICGENCYAKHSIYYTALDSYFYGFSAWRGDLCLSWDDTVDLFNSLGIITAPVLYDGPYDESVIKDIKINPEESEGYVVRVADDFRYSEFSTSLAKYVRKGHVQTDEHWMSQEIVPNLLK